MQQKQEERLTEAFRKVPPEQREMIINLAERFVVLLNQSQPQPKAIIGFTPPKS